MGDTQLGTQAWLMARRGCQVSLVPPFSAPVEWGSGGTKQEASQGLGECGVGRDELQGLGRHPLALASSRLSWSSKYQHRSQGSGKGPVLETRVSAWLPDLRELPVPGIRGSRAALLSELRARPTGPRPEVGFWLTI